MIISVKIGYTTLRFRGEAEAWKFINDVFSAAFSAENPEDMSIYIEFVKEKEDKRDDTV